MLTFVAYLWRQPGYHTEYRTEHVQRWARMIRAHYHAPCRLVVVSELEGDHGDVDEVLPLGTEHRQLINPHGSAFPSCYRRLRIWSHDAGGLYGGDRLVLLDLDCTILEDITPLFDRPEPVVIWRDPGFPRQPYNGGMIMLTAGARPDVWDRFAGERSIREARLRGFKGSDQAWIAHVLGRGMPTWTAADGVHSWKRDLRRGEPLPSTRIAMFHGRDKPWHHGAVPAVYR